MTLHEGSITDKKQIHNRILKKIRYLQNKTVRASYNKSTGNDRTNILRTNDWLHEQGRRRLGPNAGQHRD